MALSARRHLGPYDILGPLGAGGMGEVHRARDTRLGRDVAIKVLPERVADNPQALARFEREAKAVAALSHPNVLAVYDYGREDATAYVVMELLDGETLRAALSGGALPVRKAVDYAVQAAHGLAAAHEKGIVHRDVKPENLFVTRDGRIKVLDFGLAAHDTSWAPDATSAPTLSQGTEAGVVLGTVGYMSPEQVRGARADHRSDIFALGCVLYEMLAGRRAFQGETAPETMTAILKDDVPEWPETGRHVPPALDRLLRRCLEKKPEERLQSARDLAIALEALTAGDASAATVPPPLTTGARRDRLLRVAGLFLAGASLGYLAAEMVRKKGGDGPPEPAGYEHLTFLRGYVPAARFTPDGRSAIYSAIWDSAPSSVHSVPRDNPTAMDAPLAEAHLFAVSRDGELALCLRPELGFFTSRGTLARLRPGGGAPREVLEDVLAADWSPEGELAVVRRRGGHTALEFPVGKTLYQTSGWISSARFSPAGGHLAFLEHPIHDDNRGWPAVVDLATGKKRNLAPEFYALSGLAWRPGGQEVCFASQAEVLCVPGDGTSKTRLLTRGAQILILHDISTEGDLLVTAQTWFGSLMVSADGGPERDLSRLSTSVPVDFTPDGRHLLFSEMADYGIRLGALDGSPSIRLGDGLPTALSPDGRWVLAIVPQSPTQLLLLPTGPGSQRLLPRGGLAQHFGAGWLPDGRRVVVSGAAPGQPPRLYLQDVEGGDPLPFSADGLRLYFWAARTVSPDGRQVLALDADLRPVLVPLDGGPSRPLPGLGEDLVPLGWAGDVRTVFARPRSLARLWPIDRVDVLTGRRERWRTIGPSDPTGTPLVYNVQVSPDGRRYAYSAVRFLSDLCVVSGVRGAPTPAPGPRP